MRIRRIALGLAALASLSLTACNRGNTAGEARPDATVARATDASASPRTLPTTPPDNLLVTIRGASLRRAIPLLIGGGGAAEVVEQLSRQVTPGIANHGDQIDVDSPFAVAGILSGEQDATLVFSVAWPLRPGMQIAQDARSLRGFRLVSEGVYAPTGQDAGAGHDGCWVAQRQPVGWMLLCGPSAQLPQLAGYLHSQAANNPENAAVLDVDVRVAIVRRLLTRQLAELDQHAPPAAGADPRLVAQRAMYEDMRRTANLYTSLANDFDTLRGTITQDENAMHLRVEANMPRATSDLTRALSSASAGRQAPPALVSMLPAAVSSWIVSGFDRARLVQAFGAPALDPSVAAQAGPELARVMTTVDELKNLLPLGERIDAYSNEDGQTMYHVIRRPDAAQFVNDLRVALNSIPPRPMPGGGTLRDIATSLPTPGLTGLNYLRVGRNVHIPPGVQVPEAVRAEIERSMLLVADGDHLVAIMSRDPIARFRAMPQGARLSATVPANSVMAGRITPPAFPPLFYGAPIPGLPPTTTADGIDFSIVVETRGEGAHAELRADAPINAAMEVRTIYAMIQELQARMMQQMVEQQQRAMQQQQQGGGGGGGGGPVRQRPRLDPSMLPEPPRFQLQPPQ